jgi:hypothetical protein
MVGGRLGRVRGTASAGRFPMGTAAGAPQRLTKLYLGNCARTEEAGSRSRRKRKDSHDLLEVVVELESVTEQLRHRYLVCRLPLAFAHLDPELPGAQGALTLMSTICSCLLRSFPRQGGSYLIRKIHGYRAGGSTRR